MDDNRQSFQSKLNKTTKFSHKPGSSNLGLEGCPQSNLSNPAMGRFEGHNYTVSINFNRPQQSKGQRPKPSKLLHKLSHPITLLFLNYNNDALMIFRIILIWFLIKFFNLIINPNIIVFR